MFDPVIGRWIAPTMSVDICEGQSPSSIAMPELSALSGDSRLTPTLAEADKAPSAAMDIVLSRYLQTHEGAIWDDDAQMYFYRDRSYDPRIGRFISEDLIGFDGEDTNLNRYVGNSVTVATDPSGLIIRTEVGVPDTGRSGAFVHRWNFALNRTYDFDVVIVQRVTVDFAFYRCGPGGRGSRTVGSINDITYLERIAVIPAGSTRPEGLDDRSVMDVWSSGRGFPGFEGRITMEAQVRAFRLTPEIEHQIENAWDAEGGTYRNRQGIAWTTGELPATQRIGTWWKTPLEWEVNREGETAFQRLEAEWQCGDADATVRVRDDTPSAPRHPFHVKVD